MHRLWNKSELKNKIKRTKKGTAFSSWNKILLWVVLFLPDMWWGLDSLNSNYFRWSSLELNYSPSTAFESSPICSLMSVDGEQNWTFCILVRQQKHTLSRVTSGQNVGITHLFLGRMLEDSHEKVDSRSSFVVHLQVFSSPTSFEYNCSDIG